MVQNARVGFLGRVGQALTNPTTRETAQRQAVEADARTLALQDETELFNFLEQDGAARGGSRIIDGASGAFATTTLEDGTVVDSGLQELTKTREDGQLRFSKQTLAVANATRSIGTYKDENGNEVQGKVAGISTNDDGSYSLVMQRPDGKFAPKTWLSSTNSQDQVVKMSKEEFKDFMQLNLGVIQSRVKKNKGQAATALAEADRLGLFEEEGALVDEIDKDPNMSMEEKQEAILQIQQLIAPKVDKTGTNTTPLDIDTPTTQATSTTPESTNQDQIAPEGQRLPVYTVDTDSKPVQASENLLNNLSAETILSDGEIETLAGGLSKGFQQSFIKSYKFGQRLLDKNANDIATLEAKETRSSAEDRELQKLQTTRQKSLIPQQEKRLSRVRDNITTDRGSIEEARKASEAKLNAQITAKEKQIANPNLSEARKKELQAELTTLKKDSGVETVDITTDTNTYTVTDLPAANAAPEDFNNWYNTNKESLNQISKDGTIVNDVKKIITKFNVQSKEDVENIPFNTPAALDMSRFQFATILAGNGPGDFQTNLRSNMTSFDVYGEKGQLMRGRAVDSDITQSRFAQTTRTWRNSLTDRLAGFDTELDTLYGDTIDLIYPVGTSGKNQGKILSNNNLSSPGVAQRLTRIMGKVEANQNSPKFVLDRSTGKYIVQGNATPASLAATKGLAGFLFAEAVRAEGSVDFPDWFADTFAQRSEGQDLGQILDRVRYTETPNGQIDEIFYVDSNGAELDGSIKVPELIGNFGQEGSYARNLLLAYIAKDGRLRKQ